MPTTPSIRITASSSSSSSPVPAMVTIKREPPNKSRPNLTRLVAFFPREEEEDKDEEVARCVVWRKKKTGKTLFVSRLEVSEKFRRRGIASKLLDEVERLVKESDALETVELTVNAWNANAIALYEKRGFKALEEAEGDVVKKMIELAKDPLKMVQKRMTMDVVKM